MGNGRALFHSAERARRQVGYHLVPLLLIPLILLTSSLSYASTGTEGAAFLNIPVGAGPASLGSAYSALATDAYAPIYNPAGLASVQATQIAAQQLSYLESINYEYLSLVAPLSRGSALGFSAQYLGTGDINSTDVDGTPLGTFSSRYGAYSLSYGHTLTDKLSLGLTGKWINAQIDGVSANAYAADLGSLYKATDKLNLAATVTNMGTQLKFLDNGDSLPLAGHLSAAYAPNSHCLLTAEGIYPQTGLASLHVGGQWTPLEAISLRAGYRTDTLKENSALAGFSTGIGLNLWGQELAYAWVPYGDLGNTQYFSLLINFGAKANEKRNLVRYQNIKTHTPTGQVTDIEQQQLMQLLSYEDEHLAQSQPLVR